MKCPVCYSDRFREVTKIKYKCLSCGVVYSLDREAAAIRPSERAVLTPAREVVLAQHNGNGKRN